VACLPAGLEAVGDAGDHDGGDVAVDAADAGQAVSEAAGLGDFGDIVFDEPGFVGVAGVVKVHAFEDGSGGVGAVDGGPPDAAGHGGAAQPGAAGAAEDHVVVVAVDDFLEQVDQERGQVDVPDGGRGFGWSKVEVAADFMQGSYLGVNG
jgi:hypothetical protein